MRKYHEATTQTAAALGAAGGRKAKSQRISTTRKKVERKREREKKSAEQIWQAQFLLVPMQSDDSWSDLGSVRDADDDWSDLGSVRGCETDDESAWCEIGSEGGEECSDVGSVPLHTWAAGDFPSLVCKHARTGRVPSARFRPKLCGSGHSHSLRRSRRAPPTPAPLVAIYEEDGKEDGEEEEEGDEPLFAPLKLADETELDLPCRRTGHTLRARCCCSSCTDHAQEITCVGDAATPGHVTIVDVAREAVGRCGEDTAVLRWLAQRGVVPVEEAVCRSRATATLRAGHASHVRTLRVSATLDTDKSERISIREDERRGVLQRRRRESRAARHRYRQYGRTAGRASTPPPPPRG